MKNIEIPYAPALLWGIFIFILSVLPGKDFPSIPDWGDLLSLDKIVHMTFYGLLTWLVLNGKKRTLESNARNIENTSKGKVSLFFAITVAVLSSAYGWFLEWVQGKYCQDRMSDVMDGVANTMGAAFGLFIFLFFQEKKTNK